MSGFPSGEVYLEGNLMYVQGVAFSFAIIHGAEGGRENDSWLYGSF